MAIETDIQAGLRIAASKRGDVLWRNNNGAGKLENGSFVRWGICNDSQALNEMCKSSDLIGIKRVTVTQAMVGKTVGVFYAREVKRSGWMYRGTAREVAQKRFIDIVNEMGGDAAFATGEGDL